MFLFTKKKENVLLDCNDPVIINRLGIEAEKSGDIDLAIKLYEKNITNRFEGSHPYNRLSIIYRNKKMFDEEKRVLLTAIDVFKHDVNIDRSDREPKLAKFQKRLDSVNNLIKKS